MIREIRDKYEKMSNDELRVVAERLSNITNGNERVRTGGRIIGRRKASKDLLFLDLQSNGENIQVMLDHTKLVDSLYKHGP